MNLGRILLGLMGQVVWSRWFVVVKVSGPQQSSRPTVVFRLVMVQLLTLVVPIEKSLTLVTRSNTSNARLRENANVFMAVLVSGRIWSCVLAFGHALRWRDC